jgi:hypothetical protein|tara:strand:+ start:85 stop:663 length:579 start_codon:yes stop_codon:yes gene_type:complete
MPIKKKRSTPSKAAAKRRVKQVKRKKVVRLLKEKKLSGFPKGHKPKSGERFPTAKRGGKTYVKGAKLMIGADRGIMSEQKTSEFSLLVPKVKPASKGYLNDLDAAAWKIKNALGDEKIIQRSMAKRAKKEGKDPVQVVTRRKVKRRATGGRARTLEKRLITIAKRTKKVNSVLAKRKSAIKAKVAKKKTTSR